MLNSNVFELEDFDDFYDETVEAIEETPYDTIISANAALSFLQGLEELLNYEFRMAVIDHYRSDGISTYNIVKSTYPGYFISLSLGEVNDQDFEIFCQDLDDNLSSYGTLDLEDPFFVDSVDARMFRAISAIYETGESDLKSILLNNNSAQFYDEKLLRRMKREVQSILNPSRVNSSPAEVAEVVLFFIFMQYLQGDIIKQSVWEAYLINNDVVSVPTVTTEFSVGNSATSVSLNGYVLENGGADVSSRGITWATFYNPTTEDYTETSGTGLGNFSITLDGLMEGAIYYARTYATNSAGTAYGNCITFIAQSTVGMEEITLFAPELSVYPNPASTSATFRFQLEFSESMRLSVVNLKGQVVYHHDLGILTPGENLIELDLSGIPGGIYSCQLKSKSTTKATCKLVIAR